MVSVVNRAAPALVRSCYAFLAVSRACRVLILSDRAKSRTIHRFCDFFASSISSPDADTSLLISLRFKLLDAASLAGLRWVLAGAKEAQFGKASG